MTTLLVTILLPRSWFPRTLVMTGGLWALLPDLYWVSPVATQRLKAIHQTAIWTDVFWLHRTLDQVDPSDSKLVVVVMVVFLLIATAIAEARGYRAPKPVRAVYDKTTESESTQ